MSADTRLDEAPPIDETDPVRTVRLLREARDASPDVARELQAECVRMNMPLARSLASRYGGRGVPTDDLNQVAYVGLLKAVRRFDPDRGDPFLAFAAPTIRGELRRHFRDSGWMIRPPRRVQELQASVWAVEESLESSLRREPTTTELADALHVDRDSVTEAMTLQGCFAPTSLDSRPVGAPDADVLADRLGHVEEGYERAEARMRVVAAIETLKDRDRRIVQLRFVDELTQHEIGAVIGVTQMQVSRLLHRIMRDLRLAMEQDEAA
jgi:RNA polymerase sigma-B factor